PPQVTIVSPADGSEATAAVIPVTVHVTASGAVSVVTIAGIQATAAGGGDWTAQVPLALGDNTLSISATDVFGLTGTAQLAVHYRDPATEPLTVQAVEPAPGATDVQPDSMVSITFNKAFDPASLPAGFTVLQDGKAVEGGYAISPSSQTASFVPRGPLTESAHLQVRVSGVAPGVGLGMSGDFVSDFTVRRPLTQVSGIVLDQQHKPLADVAVTLESQNLTARTGPDGNWTIFAARGGSGVLRFDGPKLADGRPLPTVRHTLFINAEGVTQDRTLVLVPIEGASAQRIDTLLPVSASFNGTQPGLLLETSAGSLTLPDGQTSGYVTATRVPAYAAPASRTGRTPVAVWQLGPPQTSFTKPVTLTMPNLHGLSAGQHAVVYGYDPILNRVLPLGLAKVSDDASVMVSDALSAPSFEFFGYAGLTDAEQALYANGVPTSPSAPSNLRRVPGPSLTPQQQLKGKGALLRPSDAPLPLLQGPASLGLFGIKDALAQPDDNCVGGSCQLGGLGFLFNIPDLEPRWTHVSGRVRSPGEDQTEVEPSAPTPAGKTRITLPYSLAASFSVTRRPDPYGGSNIVNAQLTAFANGTQPIAAPPGETWTGTGDGAASASGNVPLQFGTNKIVMTGQSALGVTSITYLAQVDPASGDAGTDQADLTVTKVEDKTADEPLKDLIIYPNQPVEIGGEESMAVTGLTGTYFYVGVWWGLDVDYQNFAQFPLSSHGVRMPDGRVRRVPGVYFGQTPPYTWNSWGTDGVDMMVDARTISGTLTFVDKDGTPLPPACDDGSPTQRNDDGTLSALSARSVGTTEVHFFLEDDLEHPIADYTLGAPVADQGGCSAQGHAHGFYTQLRIGPSDFRKKVRCNELRQANLTSLDYYKAWCIDDQRKHALELKTHDRLVVFAVNHDTGYSGITTVEVPPILTSSPGCENLPDVVFNFQGRVQHLPACTNANITIPANLKLYPPEIDVRVARRAPDEGVKAPTDEGSSPPPTDHLVRQGGSATTRDEFFKIATHWRVRKAANPPPAQSDGAPDPECTKYTESDGGVVYKASADGGACKPARIQDSDTDAGSPLEVYCSEVPDGGDLSTCIHDDTVLVDVPQGVPPIAGRIWSQTGTAAGEPMPIVFDLGPGQHTSLVSPSVSFRNADGALTSAGNLSRANYFVQVVGKPLTPQEPPPPDFTDDPQAQGRPKGAIGLKNVYRALDGSGRMQERFDRAREHQFSVIQIGDHSVVAQTSAGTRDLTADGANASASDEDVSYQFLMQVLEPEGDVSRTPPPGQYELRLGGDVVGETCQLQIQGTGASKSLSGTCAGESLMDVLSASDILYIELYLSGNAENILYRFNFNGLTLREDQLSVGMATTDGKLAKSEVDGTPTPRRPVMSPALAEFFVQPSEVKHGVVKICLDRDCASSNSALKVMQFDWNDATSDYKVITTGGRADLTAVPPTKREGFGIDNAAFYTLPLPNDLLSGSQTLKDGLYVHYEPTEPRLKPFSRSLGRPQHQLESQAVSPPGHPLAAGIDITDGHLSRIWVDLQVPEGGGKLAFARAYNNQNNEIHTMGLGWWHNFEGQVLEERGGRYTVLLGGQGYEFSKCETTRDENLLVTDVSGCQSNKDHGGKLDVTVQGGVSYTFVFTRGTDGVKFTFDRPMQFDAVQKRGEGGRRWLMTSIDDGLGTTDVKYLTKSDLVDTAGRRGGHHQLKFLYSEVDDGPDGCGAFGNKIARKLTRAQRNSNFKLLKEVQLKRGEDTIDRAVYEHEMDAQTCAVTAALRVGNLTGVRKDSEQPAWHTTYKYKDVPASADEKSWPLRNELEEAKFLLGAQEALHSHWVIHHASGVSPYPHVDVNEVVDDVVETGQASIPVHTTYNGDTARVVSMPGRTPITYTLNSFGNPVNTQGAEGTATATWDSNSDDGPVVLTAEQAADGQGITTTYDPVTLQPLTVTLASGHAGAVQSSTISAGTVLIGGSEPDPRWNQPTRFSLSGTPGSAVRTFDATGQISSLTVGGIQVSTASHDSEGALEAATLPSGAVVQYSGKNGNGQPTAVNVSHGTSADFALEYDEFGRLIHKSNSADGSDETWAYDSLGRVTKHTASGSPPRVEENAYTDTDEGYSVVRSLNGTALETESWQDNRIRSRSTGGGLMTVTYDYDEAGRLDTETQVIGGGKTIVRKHTYDDAGREIAVTLNGKALVTRVLDAAGNATLVTDQDGLTTQIGYDALGRAVTWTQGASTRQVDLDSSTGQIMLELSGSHIVRTERDAVGRPKNITSVGQPGGLHVQYTGTDAAGHVDSMQTDGLSETYEYADYRGRMTKRTRSTAGGTLTETWTYAPASGGESITYQQSGGAADHTTVTTYDSLGRLLSRQETVDSQASVTSYTYDSLGHIATETQPNGGTIVYEADALGHVTKRTDSAGIVTSFTVDALGRVLTQTGPRSGESWTFEYDDFNRQTKRTLSGPHGGSWTTDYGMNGVVTMTDPEGITTTQTFDAAHRKVYETEGGSLRTIAYYYDGDYERQRVISEGGSVRTFTTVFNDRNLPVNMEETWTGPAGSYDYSMTAAWSGTSGQITQSWGGGSRSFHTTIDGLGNTLSRDDGPEMGTWTYDAAGLLTSSQLPGQAARTITYEESGRPVLEQQGAEQTLHAYYPDGTEKLRIDPSGRSATMEYDLDDRPTSVSYAGVTRTMGYEDGGNKPTRVDDAGKVSTMTYGPRGELMSLTLPIGTVTYDYDRNLRLTGVHAPNLEQSFGYDPLGRPTSRSRGSAKSMSWTTTWAAGEATTTDADGNQVIVSLDGRERTIKRSYRAGANSIPGLQDVTFTYDDLDQLVGATRHGEDGDYSTSYMTDSRGRVTSITSDDGTSVAYDYGAHGLPTKTTTPGGSVVYAYDEFGRVSLAGGSLVAWEPGGERLSLVESVASSEARCYTTAGYLQTIVSGPGVSGCGSSSQVYSRFDYTYDVRGNRMTELYTDGRGGTAYSTFDYDASDRLIGQHRDDGSDDVYTLRFSGVRDSETQHRLLPPPEGETEPVDVVHTINYALDDAEKLNGIVVDGVQATVQTDLAGRTHRFAINGLDRKLDWDAAGRLVRSTTTDADANFTIASHRYDHLNRRIETLTIDDITTFTWGLNTLLEEKSGLSSRTYARVGDVALSVGGEQLMHDAVESAVGRASETGLVASSRFDAWGTYLSGAPTGTDPTPGFAGQSWDPKSQLSYAEQRWYAPELGRFLSEDAIGATPGRIASGMGLGGFAYAGGNPTNVRDPKGLFEEPTHGALTYWMSYYAGFTEPEAATIALGAAGVDHNPATLPADMSRLGITIRNGLNGQTTHWHFADPREALDRVWEVIYERNTPYYRFDVLIDEKFDGFGQNTRRPSSQVDLYALGRSLHTLEDVGFEDEQGPHMRGLNPQWGNFDLINSAIEATSPNGRTGHPIYVNEDGTVSQPRNHTADQLWTNPKANTHLLSRIFSDVIVPAAKVVHPGSHGEQNKPDVEALLARFVSQNTKEGVEKLLKEAPPGAMNSYWNIIEENCAADGTGDKDFQARRERLGRPQLGCEYAWQTKDIDNSAPEKYGGSWWGKQWDRFTATPVPLGDPTRALPVMIKAYWDRAHRKSP
ncbi:MAG: Ig-like domain-containing protein, partial [Deltaproteobacteria bacterium]|nr:Ig-like domain-containing protein [Deltaproteobacteria bacterium]